MSNLQIAEELVKKIISVVDEGLVCGRGKPIPGEMCVEAAICYSLGLDHGDDPGCVDECIRRLKIRINDACWPNKKARAKGLRKLAILQLGTKNNFDYKLFVIKLKEKFPFYVDAVASDVDAVAAAVAAVAADVDTAAADVDTAAATAAATAEILFSFTKGVEEILIEMNVPGVQYLHLLGDSPQKGE